MTMIPSNDHDTIISYPPSFDRTELTLADVEEDSPIVRAAVTNLEKRTKLLQGACNAVLQDAALVRENMAILRESETRLDKSVADLAALLPAFGQTAHPAWNNHRRSVAASRGKAEEDLLSAFDAPLRTILDRCVLALDAQRRYEKESRGYYSETHKWLGREGAPAATALAASGIHRACSSSSGIAELTGIKEDSQQYRELNFLLTRLQLYSVLLGLHGGKAELSLAMAVLQATDAPHGVEARAWCEPLVTEERRFDQQNSACRHRILGVEQQLGRLLASPETEDNGVGGPTIASETRRTRSRSPVKKSHSHQQASNSERMATGAFREIRRQVVDRLQAVPSSTSSSLLSVSLSAALQRLKPNHFNSSASESDVCPQPGSFAHPNARRESVASISTPPTPNRFPFIRVPSTSKKHAPRRSISLSSKAYAPVSPVYNVADLTMIASWRPNVPTSDELDPVQHIQCESSDRSGSSSDWVNIDAGRASLQPDRTPPSPMLPAHSHVPFATHDTALIRRSAFSSPSNSSTHPTAFQQRDALDTSPLRKKEGILWVTSKQMPASFGSSEAPRGVKRSSQWREAWVVVSTGHIAEYADWREKKALLTPSHPMIDLRFATVREAKALERKFTFEVVTRDSRRFYQASSEETMREWLRTILNAIESLFNGTSSVRQVDKVARIEGEANRLGGTSAFPRVSFDELSEQRRWSQGFAELGVAVAVAPGKLFGGNGGVNSPTEPRKSAELSQQRSAVSASASGSIVTCVQQADGASSTSSSGISNRTPFSAYVQAQTNEVSRSSGIAQHDDAFFDQQIAAAVLSSFGDRHSGRTILSPPTLSVTRASMDVPFSPKRLSEPTTHPRSRSAVASPEPFDGPLPSSKRSTEVEIDRLSRLPGNSTCADCRAPNPRWASWSLAGSDCCIFICIECSGVHRSLGVHLSKVKSVELDLWTEEQVGSARRWGNEKVNRIFEELREERGCAGDGEDGASMLVDGLSRVRGSGKMFWVKKYVEQAWRREPFGSLSADDE